jgi:hypothetical protein
MEASWRMGDEMALVEGLEEAMAVQVRVQGQMELDDLLCLGY